MRVTIFGSGYVGLVTGTCLADAGNHVLCVDVDKNKVAMLERGEVPIYEPGLDALVKSNYAAGRLRFTTDIKEGVDHGLFQFIAVGTPPDESGSADLRHVLTVAHAIGEHMTEYKVVVTKSTVPVGTGDLVKKAVARSLETRGQTIAFDTVSNPEFLKEGAAISDFMKPDRIVIGSDAAHAAALMKVLYEPFTRNRDRVILMDMKSSELTKYAANALLATKISFMNELANLSEQFGADIEEVRIGIGSDPRIGYAFIYPGIGYGGSCFPKDVQALVRSASQIGYDARLLQAVEHVNEKQKLSLVSKILKHFTNVSGLTFAIWGLAFKPNTDDMREAPSRTLIEALWQHGANVRAYDPVAMSECRRIYGERPDLALCETAMSSLINSDALIIVTEWKEFRSPDFDSIKASLKSPVIFDGRNIYEPTFMSSLGFTYYSIGRRSTRTELSH